MSTLTIDPNPPFSQEIIDAYAKPGIYIAAFTGTGINTHLDVGDEIIIDDNVIGLTVRTFIDSNTAVVSSSTPLATMPAKIVKVRRPIYSEATRSYDFRVLEPSYRGESYPNLTDYVVIMDDTFVKTTMQSSGVFGYTPLSNCFVLNDSRF
jgi:hypothetical protein